MRKLSKILLVALCLTGSLTLISGPALACLPTPGDPNNTVEGHLRNSNLVFEGHLVRYERYDINADTYPKSKDLQSSYPISVAVYAVDKNWKGAKDGQEIKVSPNLFIVRLIMSEKEKNDYEFRLPKISEVPQKTIIALSDKADFSKEVDVIYEGTVCPSEVLGFSPNLLKTLNEIYPQANVQ